MWRNSSTGDDDRSAMSIELIVVRAIDLGLESEKYVRHRSTGPRGKSDV
jgi:hypothetical protein